jgi:hypothetical protein
MSAVTSERREAVRTANIGISKHADIYDFPARVPFLCECGAICTGFVRTSNDTFKLVASQAGWYLSGDGHGHRVAVFTADGGRVLAAA